MDKKKFQITQILIFLYMISFVSVIAKLILNCLYSALKLIQVKKTRF